jgi:recombination protein RecA
MHVTKHADLEALGDLVNGDAPGRGKRGLELVEAGGKGVAGRRWGLGAGGWGALALRVLAQAQKLGGVCAFMDGEHALDIGYAKRLGVQADDLLIAQPDYGEQALEITDRPVKSGAVDVTVVDSVAALVPKTQLEGDMDDSHVGLHGRLITRALGKLTGNVSRSNTLIIFINQLRMKIGVMFGSPETTTGGNALKFTPPYGWTSVAVSSRRTTKSWADARA